MRLDDLVDAELDKKAIAHLDFHPPMPCRVRIVYLGRDGKITRADERCGRISSWTATCNHCGSLTWLCTECKVASLLRPDATCNHCRTVEPAVTMFRYERVGGTS